MDKIFQVITALFYLPHFVLYKISSSRELIYEDLCVNAERRHSRVYKKYGANIYFFVLIRDEYYKKVFYYRIGGISKIVEWYSPGCRYFSVGDGHKGGGIFCPHAYSTILHAKSIGKNFACRQCTTIGNKSDYDGSCPIIGDNVSLGANVVIIGDVSIGDNVIIGAGSVVVKDIPCNCIACGNPARVIRTIDSKE